MSRKDLARELAELRARQAALLDWAAAELGTSLIHRRIREHLGVDASAGAMASAMRAALNGRGFPEADPVLPETEPTSVFEPADWATSTHVKVTVSGDRSGAMTVTSEPVVIADSDEDPECGALWKFPLNDDRTCFRSAGHPGPHRDREGVMWDDNGNPVDGELCSDKAGPHTEHDWRDAEDLDVLIPCPGIREPESRW